MFRALNFEAIGGGIAELPFLTGALAKLDADHAQLAIAAAGTMWQDLAAQLLGGEQFIHP